MKALNLLSIALGDTLNPSWSRDGTKRNNSEFNQYVKTNNLNKPLDKTTKVVYIRSNKIPKPLIKSDWKASSALLLSSFRTDNNTSCLLDMFDLVVHYDDNVSQMLRYQKKIEEV